MDKRVDAMNKTLRDAGSWMHIRTLGTQNVTREHYMVEEDGVWLGCGDTLDDALKAALDRSKAKVALLEEVMGKIG